MTKPGLGTKRRLMTKWHLKIQTVGYTAAEFTLVAAAIAIVVVIAKYAL
jgi:hypothetical protein